MQRASNPLLIAALAVALTGCTITTRTTRSQGGTTVSQGGDGETQAVETQGAEGQTDQGQDPVVQGAATPENQNAIQPEPVVIEQPEVQEIPEDDRARPTRVGRQAAMGEPTLTPGEAVAFWVWMDDDGWHVRTTSDRERRTFRGSIRLTGGGSFQNLAPANTNHHDRWEVDDRTLTFAFRTAQGRDGLDFKSDARCIRLNLRVDDEPAQSVRTGAEAREAGSHLLRICTR